MDETSLAMLSGIVHEVRNALFGMSATVDAMENRLASKCCEHIEALRLEFARLQGLVADLDACRTDLAALQPLSFAALIRDVVEQTALNAKRRDVALTMYIGSDVGDVAADQRALSGALSRALLCAIERTPAGGSVRVQAHRVVHGSRAVLRCTVTDSGPSIPPDAVADAFMPFARLPGQRMGLALYLAEKVFRAHGGEVAIENVPFEGVRLTLTVEAFAGEGPGPKSVGVPR